MLHDSCDSNQRVCREAYHSALLWASEHCRRIVDFQDCHRKTVKAAEAADRLAVVESAAAVDAGAAGGGDVFVVVCRWEERSRGRTRCELAIAGAGSEEEVWR